MQQRGVRSNPLPLPWHAHHVHHAPPAPRACAASPPLLQTESQFAAAYASGIHKSRYWEPYFEDALNLIAKLPAIVALIYRRTFKGGAYIAPDASLDWAANLSHMMGYDDPGALELMRLYQTIHSDHEGGNVSAHATHLVGSALSDPYLSFAAGMCGLAGPLHGLANQEVLRWLQDVQAEVRARAALGRRRARRLPACWPGCQGGRMLLLVAAARVGTACAGWAAQLDTRIACLPDSRTAASHAAAACAAGREPHQGAAVCVRAVDAQGGARGARLRPCGAAQDRPALHLPGARACAPTAARHAACTIVALLRLCVRSLAPPPASLSQARC